MNRRPADRRWQRAALGWMAALGLAVTAGCQSAFGPSFEPPAVSVEGFDLSRPGLFTQELLVTLTVNNRMSQAVTIEAVDLELEVNGTRLGSGTLLKSIPLDADAAVVANVPVKVKTQDILNAIFAVSRRPRLDYEISGHVRLGGGGPDGTAHEVVPFEDSGELNLPFTPSGSITT